MPFVATSCSFHGTNKNSQFMLLVWWQRIVGGRVFPSQVKAKEKKMKKEGGENNGKKNKDTPEPR